MADLTQFHNEEFLSLETFRKSGVGVKTPVWFAQDGDSLHIWTMADSGKVKRIRNNPQVNIAPCTRFGKITGEWVDAQATIDRSPEALQHVETLLRKKIGFFFALFQFIDGVRDRRKGSSRVCIKVALL